MRFSYLIALSPFFVNTAIAATEYSSYESCMLDQMHKQKTEMGAMAIAKVCQTFPSKKGGYIQPDPTAEIEAIIERKVKEAKAESKVNKETPEVNTFATTYFEFPGTFTTNLMKSRRFLQIGLGVTTQNEEVTGNIEAHQLALRSEILNVMSEFTMEEIQGKQGREALARALADGVNEKLVELEELDGVKEVHFTSFILQ